MSTFVDIEGTLDHLLAELPGSKRRELVDLVTSIVRVELINASLEKARNRRDKKAELASSAQK